MTMGATCWTLLLLILRTCNSIEFASTSTSQQGQNQSVFIRGVGDRDNNHMHSAVVHSLASLLVC